MQVKYLKDPGKFLVDSGLLFEINRRVLHPFGLALAIEFPDSEAESKLAAESENCAFRLWDNRDDPEGIDFVPEGFEDGLRKYNITVEASKPKFETRRKALGYVVQGCSPDQTAQVAYDAYGNSTGWVNFLGKPMPKWVDLPAAIQQAWRDATAAVVEP